MSQPIDHSDQEQAIQAILRDRQRLRRLLPRIVERAETTLPPYLEGLLASHRLHIEEARLYCSGMGQAQIAALHPGRSKQVVDQGIKKLVERFLTAYPELLEGDDT